MYSEILTWRRQMDREQILKEAQAFFFEAMVRGYADPVHKPIPVPEKPGFKQFIYRNGDDWRLVDEWATNPDSNFSFGTTTIWYKERVVWMMQYSGRYPKEVIPFLKKVLERSYKDHQWHGGRGLEENFECDGLIYRNDISGLRGFDRFRGCENIWNNNGKWQGRHEYHGMALI